MRATVAGLVVLALTGCGTTSTSTTTDTASTGSMLAAALSTAYAAHVGPENPLEVQREDSRCHDEGVRWECTLPLEQHGDPLWVSTFQVQLGEDHCFTATETANQGIHEHHPTAPEDPVKLNGCLPSP